MEGYKEVRYAKFLGEDVRIVDFGYHKRFIVLRDIFGALGRLQNDGKGGFKVHKDDKDKYEEFIKGMELEKEKDYLIKYPIKTKKVGGRNSSGELKGNELNGQKQKLDLINIEQTPIVLTQFQPTKKSKNYEEKIKIWYNFMKFVNSILQDYHMEDYIIDDKEMWKEDTKLFGGERGMSMQANVHTNINMAKLLGVYDQGIKKIKKEELKNYENQTTMDLLAVRQELYHDYAEIYCMFGSRKLAKAGSLNKAIKKYNLDIPKEDVKVG